LSNQIDAWKGKFGDDYHARQDDVAAEAVKRKTMWTEVLHKRAQDFVKILEIGAGSGANLRAINNFYNAAMIQPFQPCLFAIEPHPGAAAKLAKDGVTIVTSKYPEIEAEDKSFDLVFTYGVLIHLPDPLSAMREMYRVSRRYVMCAEYFAPQRKAITYRDGVPLFKDDYGGLWMDNFDVKLIGYGFCWKRATRLDNVTWWLFEKT
jgi:pseudaminic acid biosynthesis-associated methylase